MKRKQYTKELKVRIALDAIKGHKTVNALASEYEVLPTQTNHWKKPGAGISAGGILSRAGAAAVGSGGRAGPVVPTDWQAPVDGKSPKR